MIFSHIIIICWVSIWLENNKLLSYVVVFKDSDVSNIAIAVSALNVMFTSLNSPSKLSGWKSRGGDPCGDSWEGIQCSGSSVTQM
jgi:hypothetical protein